MDCVRVFLRCSVVPFLVLGVFMRTEEELHQRHQHLHRLLQGLPSWPLASLSRDKYAAELKTKMETIEWVLDEN